ncbi:MAG: hypothetical protein IPP29_09585 [Bacteroidetes bacterium]|nr:hypothetical protein [Bacteroidota bacterium]
MNEKYQPEVDGSKETFEGLRFFAQNQKHISTLKRKSNNKKADKKAIEKELKDLADE